MQTKTAAPPPRRGHPGIGEVGDGVTPGPVPRRCGKARTPASRPSRQVGRRVFCPTMPVDADDQGAAGCGIGHAASSSVPPSRSACGGRGSAKYAVMPLRRGFSGACRRPRPSRAGCRRGRGSRPSAIRRARPRRPRCAEERNSTPTASRSALHRGHVVDAEGDVHRAQMVLCGLRGRRSALTVRSTRGSSSTSSPTQQAAPAAAAPPGRRRRRASSVALGTRGWARSGTGNPSTPL